VRAWEQGTRVPSRITGRLLTAGDPAGRMRRERAGMKLNGVEFDADKIAAGATASAASASTAPSSATTSAPTATSDVLVEFLPTTRASLFDLGGMLMELRDMLGRDVDLRTPADLSKHFRNQVVAQARPLYAA
jgi:hypothetical protein